jgi:hypothetical protein
MMMMISWEGFGRKRSWLILRYYPGMSLEGLRKTTEKPQSGEPVAWAKNRTQDLPKKKC